jgi:hypothetical protein
MPMMEGTVQEDDYRTKVRFKDENLFKNLSFASSGSQRAGSANCGSGTQIWT